jgi:exonuclease VII small subunit
MTGNIDNREAVYRVYDDKIAELEATVARLRSLLGKLVEAGKEFQDAMRKKEQPCLLALIYALHTMDTAVKEATDAK